MYCQPFYVQLSLYLYHEYPGWFSVAGQFMSLCCLVNVYSLFRFYLHNIYFYIIMKKAISIASALAMVLHTPTVLVGSVFSYIFAD